MSTFIPTLVVGLSAALPASPIVCVAWGSPMPARGATDGTTADPARADDSAEAPPTSPEAPSETVLLMRDGSVRVHDGSIAEQGDAYVLGLAAGTVRLPKDQVEGRFASRREAYEYCRDHLPDRDPDERLRLARWCLEQHMMAEAAEQLEAMLAMSPGDPRAESMLRSIRTAMAQAQAVDEAVVRTGADSTMAGGASVPRELDVSVLGQFRKHRGPVDAPEIFELPPALAARRFQEFGSFIHPILQNRCASCHDETSDREFRLVRAREPADLRLHLLARTNLEATIGLIDRNNPAHSPLLINAALPHGPEGKVILPNPNAPEYRALWSWIGSLNDGAVAAPAPEPPPTLTPEPDTTAPSTTSDASSTFGGGFASGRTGPIPTQGAASPSVAAEVPAPYPHQTTQEFRVEATHPSVPEGLDFRTLSPLIGASESAPLTIDGRAIAPSGATPQPPSIPVAGAPSPMPFPATAPPPGVQRVAPTPSGGAYVPGALPPGIVPTAGVLTPNARPPAPPMAATPDGAPPYEVGPDGTRMIRLPNGDLVPFMDKQAVRKSKSTGSGKKIEIDPALIQRLQQSRAGGPGN